MASLKNTDGRTREITSGASAEIFEERWPNLLACFDMGRVYSSIATYIRTYGFPVKVLDDYSVENVVEFTEQAFLDLLNRDALDEYLRVSSLPSLAQSELDEMAGVAEPEGNPVLARVIAAVNAHDAARAAQVAQCMADIRTMPAGDLRRKWGQRPEKLEIFEEAQAAVDAAARAVADGYKQQRVSREQEAQTAFRQKSLSIENF